MRSHLFIQNQGSASCCGLILPKKSSAESTRCRSLFRPGRAGIT